MGSRASCLRSWWWRATRPRFLLSLTLRTMPVGVVYAVWSGVGVVLITLVGWLVFKQNLDVPALIGIGLIATGVVVLNFFSKAVPH